MANKQQHSSKNAKQRFAERKIADKLKKEREIIVEFFLDLYNVQLKGEEDASKHFRQASHSPGMGTTYELRVKHFGKWISRPMGINPIGEEGGSKSRCFKVIYDEVLVVKVPIRPILDFDDYIEGIGKEREVARLLEPSVKCIAPAVSPVLKKVPAFFDDMCWVPEEVEEKSLARLKHFPQFQEHLKIGRTFAYFMDISKHSFLLQVLESIMQSDEKVKKEIVKQPDIITKFHKFEERYGIDNASVWLNMNEVYQEYLEMIGTLTSQYGLSGMVHDYKRRQWFLNHLAKNENTDSDPKISDEFFPELKEVLEQLSKQYESDFDEYRKTIESYVQRESFGQSVTQISGIATSILRLLAELREKKVAIRDLKPDNIFVTGDPSKIAFALAQREDVFLGLIDFETAVCIDRKKKKHIEQPLLGGTPSYATPCNFVPNFLIEELYGDVARVLHLEDWQACLSMVYSTVTGETLFSKSRNSLYNIINSMKKGLSEGNSLANVFKANSYRFWNIAGGEFKKKIEANGERLVEIEVALPYKVKQMFIEEATRSEKFYQYRIKQLLGRQKHFANPKSVESILQSSTESIVRFREKWQNGALSPRTSEKVRQKVVRFLFEIQKMKELKDAQARRIEIFNQRSLKIDARELLEFMFAVVLQTLHKNQWRPTDAEMNNNNSAKKIRSIPTKIV